MKLALPGCAKWLRYRGAIPVAMGALLSGLFTTLASGWLRWGQTYNEPIVGASAWTDADKALDYRVTICFFILTVAATFILGISLGGFWENVRSRLRLPAPPRFFWILFPAWFLLPAIIRFPVSRNSEALIALGVAILSLVSLLRFRNRRAAETNLAALCIWVFAGVGVCVLFRALLPNLLPDSNQFLLGATALTLTMQAIAWLQRSPKRALRFFQTWLLAAQLPLVFLYFSLVPSSSPSAPLLLAVGSWSVWCAYRWWIRFQSYRKSPKVFLAEILEPSCLAAIAVFLMAPVGMPPGIYEDFFHFGERLLPWHQWSFHAKLPYRDFIPTYGVSDLATGAFHQWFFDGNALYLPHAKAIWVAIAATATILTASNLAGPIAALGIVFACTYIWPQFLWLAPITFFLLSPNRMSHSVRWLAWWIVASIFAVLVHVPVGMALCVSFLPLAVTKFLNALETRHRELNRLVLAVVGLVAACLWIPFFRGIISGFLKFFIENAAVNTTAHGVPFFFAAPVLDLYRLGWMLLVVAFGGLWWKLQSDSRSKADPTIFWLTAAVPLMGLALIPWTVGRIDPQSLSRMGNLTLALTAFITPVLLLHPSTSPKVLWLAPLVAVFLGFSPEGHSLQTFWRKAFAPVPSQQAFDSLSVEPAMPPREAKIFESVRTALSTALLKEESFFDLTNSSAFYFHFDLPVPTPYASTYVAASEAAQRRMIAALDKAPPPVVLAAPSIDFDGGPSSLRSYLLFRKYMLEYQPFFLGEVLLLLRPDRARALNPKHAEVDLHQVEAVVSQPNLAFIPAAWGRNWEQLDRSFKKIHSLPQSGGGRNVNWALPRIDGSQADYLRLSFAPNQIQPSTQLVLRWVAEGRPQGPVWFNLSGETLLVPLGAFPTWLKQNSIENIELSIRHDSNVAVSALDVPPVQADLYYRL
jgi:hypothetical protein